MSIRFASQALEVSQDTVRSTAGRHCWPLRRPRGWLDFVNQPQTEAEVAAVRKCIVRGTPFGEEAWVKRSAKRLGLGSTLRPRGRPRKNET